MGKRTTTQIIHAKWQNAVKWFNHASAADPMESAQRRTAAALANLEMLSEASKLSLEGMGRRVAAASPASGPKSEVVDGVVLRVYASGLPGSAGSADTRSIHNSDAAVQESAQRETSLQGTSLAPTRWAALPNHSAPLLALVAGIAVGLLLGSASIGRCGGLLRTRRDL